MAYTDEVLADSPVAYWRMGDTSGPIVDQTGNQNATDHGLTFGTTGIPGGGGDSAITCPNSSAYADFSSIPSAWNVGDTFTLECWLKFTSLVNATFIYGAGTGSFVIGLDDSDFPYLKSGTDYVAHLPAITLDSDWHHFVATKNGSTTHLYWDGVDGTIADANFTVGNPGSGMSLFNAFGVYIDGAMDEVAIYPTALSAARVLVHYNVGSASFQTLLPSADSVDGAWTDQAGGTSLAAAIDEATASDTDYIRSELNPSASGCRVKLSAGGDPHVSTDHVVHWRTGKIGSATINMTVKLYQGGGNSQGAGTLIASFDRNDVGSFTTYDETLSGGEADSITDYTDLYLEFFADTA